MDDTFTFRRYGAAILAWFDSDVTPASNHLGARLFRVAPFVALHLGCLGVLFVGFSWPALWCALFLYCFRVFALTGFYHRYFSHRSFKTSRFWQAVFAVCGLTAAQRGPLWWAAHHRHHHLSSDTEEDAHSPNVVGFWRSHLGWFTDLQYYRTEYARVADLARYPELVLLNRYDSFVPIIMLVALYFIGEAAAAVDPAASGWQFVVWGGCISTVAVYHATFCVNSLCHIFGRQRYDSGDKSRNNWLVALLTFGEGWHNNHHRYPASARQGFFWWEIDVTYYLLCLMEKIGIIHDLKRVPKAVLRETPEKSTGH